MAAIGKRTRQDWQEMDKDHHLHPFTDHKALHEQRSRIITRAEGVYIYDADGNRILDGMSGLWCVNAACLMIVVSKKTYDHSGRPMRSHVYDTGAAWMALAIEGIRRGYVVHGMAGFDDEAAGEYLALGDEYQINFENPNEYDLLHLLSDIGAYCGLE